MRSRKRGSNFFALKTLHIYYTTGLPLQSSERLNNATYLLYHGFWNVFVVYLLYHRVTIWWHVHCTAGWQTFSWCIHLTTGVTRVSPLRNPCIYYTTGWQLRSSERLNNALHLLYRGVPITVPPEHPNSALHLLYPRPKDVVSAPERLNDAPLVSYRGGCVWWLCVASSASNDAVAEPQVTGNCHLPRLPAPTARPTPRARPRGVLRPPRSPGRGSPRSRCGCPAPCPARRIRCASPVGHRL